MNLAFQRFKVYVRGTIIVLLTAALGLVLFMNRSSRVTFWFFGLTDPAKQTNVVWLVLSTASTTLLATRILSVTRGWWKDWRTLRRLQAEHEAEMMQAKRATELAERERRLNERLGSAGREGEPRAEPAPGSPGPARTAEPVIRMNG